MLGCRGKFPRTRTVSSILEVKNYFLNAFCFSWCLFLFKSKSWWGAGQGFPTSTSNSPAECLRIQLNPDATFTERESCNGLSPTRLPSTSDSSLKPRLTGYKSEIPMGSINLLGWLTELRKTCLLTRLTIYYKGYYGTWINSQMKRHRGQSP